jgi:hypothetical protein
MVSGLYRFRIATLLATLASSLVALGATAQNTLPPPKHEGTDLRQRIQHDAARGYRHLTIQEYVRMRPELNSKIAIPAHVRNVNTIVDNGRIYIVNGASLLDAAKLSANIILGDAAVDVQNRVIHCITSSLNHLPCSMMILGHQDECSRLILGVQKAVPCIVVHDAWNLAEVGTYEQVINLRLESLLQR